jgi:hypothetical protein
MPGRRLAGTPVGRDAGWAGRRLGGTPVGRDAEWVGYRQGGFAGVVVPVVFPLATENKVHKAE